MLTVLTDSPFGLSAVFQACRIKSYFDARGIALDDIDREKQALIEDMTRAMEAQASADQRDRSERPRPPATRTSTDPARYDGRMTCPDCGGGLIVEPICPGCEEGRSGQRLRFNCDSCEFTESV